MSSRFQLGAWIIQPSQNAISRNGTTIRLEPKMVEVLLCLAEHPGETVSKDELLRRVWRETFVTDDVLTRCISELRKAFGDDPKEPHVIQTIPRKGYRLVPPVVPIRQSAAPLYLLASLALLVVLSAVIAYERFGHSASQSAIRSLVVLPLKEPSNDPAQEYLVRGLTDELTMDLAKLGELRVISRASATHYADSQKTLQQIAKELNVDAVVTGTVQRSDNRVRVRASLVRADTGEVVWAQRYDRSVGDISGLEQDVSRNIARSLGVKLTSQLQRPLKDKPEPTPEAREAYFRANYFFDKDDREGAERCLQYFQQAIADDPKYAAAYAGLARCYDVGYGFNLLSWDEANAKKVAAAQKAIELDDELAEGHSELGDYYLSVAWDFTAAERQYRRALELDPNSAVTYEDYAYYLMQVGRPDEALEQARRAHELDPLSLHLADFEGWVLLYARRYDDAANQFRNVLQINPNYRRSRWGLVRTYELQGRYNEAVSECLKIPAMPNIDPFTKAVFQRRCSLFQKIYSPSGAERSRKWFETARPEIHDAINRDDDAYLIATLYAETEHEEKALDLLERCYAKHDASLLWLQVDPRMDKLRSNPRFRDLLHRIHFPQS
ncbi:MAG TPA: FlgO family outer membrane protein [Terriglobales bacterium]|nr:FlgO family outer membrane protein [Terriglobales bacterium]